MAGWGLSNAVRAYQDGVQWREQQDAKAKAKAADDAFSGVLNQRRSAFDAEESRRAEEAKAAGKEYKAGTFTPADADYLAAAQARQVEFAKQGDFDGYMRSAASLTPIVTQMRRKALDDYGDDPVALAKAVYPTFMDNRELKNAELLDGVGLDGKPQAKKLRLTMSDGTVKFLDADQPKAMIQRSLMTPEMQLAEAKMLYEMKRDAAKIDGEKGKDIAVAKVKGDLEQSLEKLRQEGRLSVEDVRNINSLAQIKAQGAESRATKAMPSFGDINPAGQILTTPDGGSVLVNPRTGKTMGLADAATGAPVAASKGGGNVSEGERNAGGFALRMGEATKLLDAMESKGRATVKTQAAASLPMVGGYAQRITMTPEQQQYKQAADDWIRAKLRKESGAAIGVDEMRQEYETYFPMPGDTAAVIEQKRQAREIANRAMVQSAGRGVIQDRPATGLGSVSGAPKVVDFGSLK